MVQVVLFVLSVALATVSGWGACQTGSFTVDVFSGYQSGWLTEGGCNGQASLCWVRPSGFCDKSVTVSDGRYGNCKLDQFDLYGVGTSYCPSFSVYCISCDTRMSIVRAKCGLRCDTKRETDSTVCVNAGKIWKSETGECVSCDQPDTTFKESSCAYDAARGKYLNIVNTITRTNCEVTVKEDKYYSLTCDSTCNENSELTCMGSIDGVTVYLRSCNGKVSKCEADGSCDMAIMKVANGECENPNDPTATSGSSSSEQGSSSSGGTGENWEWLKDSLHAIHVTDRDSLGSINHNIENMHPFVAGTYDQVTDIAGTAHDINSNILTSFDFLNDIKENTGNTATNTGNINNKLNTTNSLLESINQKNWHTTVNVSPPEVTVQGDTNIINVQTDTAKSGAAILDFLKGIFKGADTTNNYNPNDTAGTGHVIDSLMGKIGDLVSDSGYLTVRDSVGVAVTSMRGSYNALKDTLAHSAINDSMNRWSEAITNNGVIQGNGSENCPSILNTPFNVKIGTIDYTTTKTLGMYLCTPISPFNVTLWTLARVIIRAIVSISCMIWLYKAVLGIDGGSNEED